MPVREAGPLLNEARQDEVRTYARYQGKPLRIAGVVLQKGMEHFRREVADFHGWGVGGGFGIASATARSQGVPYPFVLLGDPAVPSADVVKCYFTPREVDIVDGVKPGGQIILEGVFYRLLHAPEHVVILLSKCAVK